MRLFDPDSPLLWNPIYLDGEELNAETLAFSIQSFQWVPPCFERDFKEEIEYMTNDRYAMDEEAFTRRMEAVTLLDKLTEKEGDCYVEYLAIDIFDRVISRQQLQDYEHVIVCCMAIASYLRDIPFSFEAVMTQKPELKLVLDKLMDMDAHIMRMLNGRLCLNAVHFKFYFMLLMPNGICPPSIWVTNLIISANRDIRFRMFRPSVIAASAVIIASECRFPSRHKECVDLVLSCRKVEREALNQCLELFKGCGRLIRTPVKDPEA